MTTATQCKCWVIQTGDDAGPIELSNRAVTDPGENEIQIQVEFSSLNYKDALAATGHPGVALTSPLIPGIDAAGLVVKSNCSSFAEGSRVIVGQEPFGTSHDGGWAELINVPANWAVPLPSTMSSLEAMAYGTAGFTAAQSVLALQMHSIKPESGPIIVTGATGGVGLTAVMLLKKLGYQVTAVTGKEDKHELLTQLGADEILGRGEIIDESSRPLLKGRFAGAVDTVGGKILSTVLRSTKRGGCVTACGLVAGADLQTTVYPFILRGITLQGIDSAGIDHESRTQIWSKLAADWSLPELTDHSDTIDMEQVPTAVEKILAGKIFGRTIIKVNPA